VSSWVLGRGEATTNNFIIKKLNNSKEEGISRE
jgi:hypothetical protein